MKHLADKQAVHHNKKTDSGLKETRHVAEELTVTHKAWDEGRADRAWATVFNEY